MADLDPNKPIPAEEWSNPQSEYFTTHPNWKWNADKGEWEPGSAAMDASNAVTGTLAPGAVLQTILPSDPGAELATGAPDEDRLRMAGLLGQLQGQAATGGGAWEQALKQNTDTARAGAMALGQSQQGVDNMTAGQAIGNAQAGATQRAAGQGNLLRAQSKQAATGQISDILGGQQATDAQQSAGVAAARQGRTAINAQLESDARKAAGDTVKATGDTFLSLFGMSDGGAVPGQPEVFGDDERNDTVRAKLSPGEIVIPRSITQRPDAAQAAAAFVEAVKARGADNKTNFDGGGQVPTFTNVDSPTTSLRTTSDADKPFDLLAPSQYAPSVARGSLLDTTQYDETRGANLANSQRLMDMYQGKGPSVAPQAMQNAADTTLTEGMQVQVGGRGGSTSSAGDIVSGSTQKAQEGAGTAAGIVAGESQRGAEAFANAIQRQRNQDLAFETAKQQAAWRNTLSNAGVGLEQQQMLHNLLGGAGQAAVSTAGLLTKDKGKFDANTSAYGYDPGTSRYDTTPNYEEPTASSPGEWENPYAEGGVVAHLARRPRAERPRDVRSPIEKWSDSPAFQDFAGGAPKGEQPTPTKKEREAEKEKGRAYDTENPDLKDLRLNMADGGGVPDMSQLPPARGITPQQALAAGAPATTPGMMDRFLAYMSSPVAPPRLTETPAGYVDPATDTPEAAAERARVRTPSGAPIPDAGPKALPMTPRPAPIAPHEPLPESPAKAVAPRVAPAPVRPSPSGKLQDAPERVLTPDELAMQAGTEKASAEAGQSEATAAALTGLQQGLESAAIQEKERRATAGMEAERLMGGIRQAREEMKRVDTEVDEGKWWGSRSVPGKIAAIIGLVLGAIGNDNGVNRAAMLIQKQIDQSIDAQKASHEMALRKGQAGVTSAENLYSLHRQMTSDDIAADAAARGSLFELTKNKVDLAAAKAGSPMAKANLSALSASLAAKAAEKDEATKQRAFDNRIKAGHLGVAQTEAAAKLKAAGVKEDGKIIPAETVAGIAELPVAMRQLDALGKTFAEKASGKMGKASSMLPDFAGRMLGTDVAEYNAQALQAMQGVGKIMEGGKLAAGDELKYKRMLPQAGDDANLAAKKIEGAKAFLSDLVETRKRTLAESGYRVPGMTGGAASDPNAAARAWLAANPNDSRAAAVRAKLGAP